MFELCSWMMRSCFCSQDASLSYDPDVLPGDIQSDVLFREGQTLGGHVTYTPRLIAMDVKGQYLAVTSLLLLFLVKVFVSLDVFHVFMCFYMKLVDALLTALMLQQEVFGLCDRREVCMTLEKTPQPSHGMFVLTCAFCIHHPSIHFSRTTLMLENQQVLESLLDKSVFLLTGREAS